MRAALVNPVVRLCLVVWLLNSADGVVSTLASAYLNTLHYPVADIGVLVAASSAASFLSRAPAGRLAEGERANRWLWLACAVFSAALLLYPFATQPATLWFARLLHGFAYGVATTVNFAQFLTASSSRNRFRATTWFTTCMAGGYTTGNFTSGLLGDHFGYSVTFVVAAIFPLVALVVSPSIPVEKRPAGPAEEKASWRLFRVADVRGIPLLAFSLNVINYGLGTLFPLYVAAIGQTLTLLGTARGLQSLTNVIIRPLAGDTLRLLGPVLLGCLGIALGAIAVVSVPLTTAPLLLFGCFILVGLGRSGGVLSNAMSTVDVSQSGVLKRGTASALMNAGGDLGAVVGPVLGGVAAALFGIEHGLQVLGVSIGILGVAGMLVGRPLLRRPQRTRAESA